jgi:plasmid stabilization system protein ParE
MEDGDILLREDLRLLHEVKQHAVCQKTRNIPPGNANGRSFATDLRFRMRAGKHKLYIRRAVYKDSQDNRRILIVRVRCTRRVMMKLAIADCTEA